LYDKIRMMTARPLAYAYATAALAAAVLIRWALDPLIADQLPLVTLFGAVAFAVWSGGYLPALVIVVPGFVVCHYLFMAPRGVLVADLPTMVGFAAYAFTCALIIAIGEAMRRAQAHAGERSELLRVTLGSIGDAVITTNAHGEVSYLNTVAEKLTGWTSEEALGEPLETVFRIVNEHTREPVPNPAARALRDRTVVGLANHTVLIAKGGGEHPIDDSAAPIKASNGEMSGCVLTFRDVTDRREFEKRDGLRLLEARLLASIVESSDDAIVRKTLDGIVQSWNAAAERLFGYPASEAIGRHISLVIPPDRLAEEDDIISRLKSGQRVEHFETVRVRRDGVPIQVSLTISPIHDASGRVVAASKIVRDVTDRKRVEADREKFFTLVENSTDFIAIFDPDGAPIHVNPAGLRMVGLRGVTDPRGAHLRDYFFPEDQARVMDEFLPSVVEHGHGEIDVRFRNFETGAARWMAYKVLKLADASGRMVGFATVSQDVTDRRRLEDHLRSLAADLSEADQRKNEFLATLAHELRNPLAPLSNMVAVLKLAGDDPARRGNAVETMDRQLTQLVRLVDDLLDLSRITHNRIELRRGRVELSSVIQQAVHTARPLIDAAGHRLTLALSRDPIYLNADPIRLSQVFGNLLNNSSKYMAPGGAITVTTAREGRDAVVVVEDTGIGIAADKLENIFDMFSQLDRSGKSSQGGLGIGLTLVRRLVQMHGGSVEARSGGEGKGSAFVVRLPIGEVPEVEEPDIVNRPTQARRILVVDDNRDAAESLSMLLSITGHETTMAHDGGTAYEAADWDRPDVLLLDLGLPTLSGYEVCRRIRQQPWGREMFVIALTGWGQDEDRQKTREAGFDGHLVKPVAYDALLRLLDSLGVGRRM
jgi:PAS domain S-box-containing protein